MVFDTDPIVIELFPLLVAIPAVVTFLAAQAIRHWSLNAEHKSPSITYTHVKRAAQIVVGIPVAAIALSAALAIAFNNDTAVHGSFFFLTVLHMVLPTFIGAFAGLILALLYSFLGVSAFVIAASLMSAIPLTAVILGEAGTAVGLVVNMMAFLAFVALLVDACSQKGLGFSHGKVKPSKQAVSQTMSHVAGLYILEAVRLLRQREQRDNDSGAREALEQVLQTEGRTGDFIRETVRRETSSIQTALEWHRGPDSRGMIQFMPRGNWTLTNSRFRRRVLLDRLLFLGAAICLFVLGLGFSSNLSTSTNQWGVVLLFGVLGFSVPLAFLDPLFRGSRPNTENTVSRILAAFRGFEGELSVEIDGNTRPDTFSLETAPVRGQEQQAVTMLSSDFIEMQERSLRSFLKAVVDGKNDVYRENTLPTYVAGAGAVIGLPAAGAIAFTIHRYIPVFHEPLIVLACVGIPLMIIGAGIWYSLGKRRSFRGCRRTRLSVALSYLDAKESGIEDVGEFMPFPSPPKQFVFLKWAGPNTSSGFLRGMQSASGLMPYPSMEREAAEIERAFLRRMLIMLPVLLVAFMAVLLISQNALLLTLFLATFVILLSLLMSASIKRKRLGPGTPTETSTEPPQNVVQVLRLLKSEYPYPLRLLTVREHAELMYTGRTLLTTTNTRFREAVFIPVVKSQPRKQTTWEQATRLALE